LEITVIINNGGLSQSLDQIVLFPFDDFSRVPEAGSLP